MPLLPAVIYRDKRWTSGVPHGWPAAGAYLRHRTGHDFPILSQLTHGRAIRALTAILAGNTDADRGKLRLHVKHLAGLVYATTVEDEALANSARILARQAGAAIIELMVWISVMQIMHRLHAFYR